MSTIKDKQAKAKALYCTGQYLQKEIASIVGVSEKTISKWKEEDGWESLQTSLLTTRDNELKRLYKLLKILNDSIDEAGEEKIPINSKQADSVLKLTAAIKNLEIETSIAEKVEVGTEFINLVRSQDIELSKTITQWFDLYIKQSIK